MGDPRKLIELDEYLSSCWLFERDASCLILFVEAQLEACSNNVEEVYTCWSRTPIGGVSDGRFQSCESSPPSTSL